MEEPVIKKKNKLGSLFKKQYIYSISVILMLVFGITYALIYFWYREPVNEGSITSNLVSVNMNETGNIEISDALPMTDEDGLNGSSKSLTIENTSRTDIKIKVSLKSDQGSTIPTSAIRYGLYVNGKLKKVDYVSTNNDIIYENSLMKDETIDLQVYLWIDYYYQESGTTFSGKFDIATSSVDMHAGEYISRLLNKEKGLYAINNSGALYNNTGTIREYRYSGLNPHNYVWFNCTDTSNTGSSNCELWRIVGVFNIKSGNNTNTYQRLKLVKDASLASQSFGSTNVFSNASLKTYLNGTYYNGLRASAKNMILNSEWYVGSTALNANANTSLTNEKTSKFVGKVGLIGASDFGYSTATTNYNTAINNSTLYNNSWLKGGTYYAISPISGSSTNVVANNGTGLVSLAVSTASGVKPCVYLSPDVQIVGGNGTSSSPYALSYSGEYDYYADEIPVAYITYDVNGERVSTPGKQPIFQSTNTVINKDLADADGRVFLGWATSATGDVVYQKGDTITTKTNITLYAKWQ